MKGKIENKSFFDSISSSLSKDISFSNPFPDRKKEQFYTELHVMLQAGMTLKDALDLLVEEEEKAKTREILTNIGENVIKGMQLSKALEYSNVFSKYEYYSIKIGEEAGLLIDVLKELAEYWNRSISQKRKIVSSLSYPILVLLTAFGTLAFLLTFVIPVFENVFKRFGGELPWITQFFIHLSNVFTKYFLLFLGAVAAFIVGILTSRKKLWFRKNSAAIVLRIPFAGGITQKIVLSKLFNSLSLLENAHYPLVESLDLIKDMIEFYPVSESLKEAKVGIMQGKPFHQCLSANKIYPRKIISLLKVAEETNQMGSLSKKISEDLKNEIEYQTSVLNSVLEPFLILFLGLIIGLILVAMYLPMFKLGNQMT